MTHSRSNKNRRPHGVTALGFFFVFGTLMSGLSAISLLTPGSFLEPMWQLNPRAHSSFASMGHWAPVLLAAVSTACLTTAYGLFTGRRWGQRLAIGMLAVNCLADIVNVALGTEPRAWIGIPITSLLIWYLLSNSPRAYFQTGERDRENESGR